jgi:sugar lactone lactonase YvrE
VRRDVGATGTITTLARIRDAYGIVAAPDGAFFVSEPPTGTVHRLDASGRLTTKVRGLPSPQSLALGPGGTLFVVEGDTGHVRVVSPTGTISTVRRSS